MLVEGASYPNWKELVSHSSSRRWKGLGVSEVVAHWSNQSAWRLMRSDKAFVLLRALIVVGRFPFKKKTQPLPTPVRCHALSFQ